jgi:uncharacterized protein YbaR (Trm112 family)
MPPTKVLDFLRCPEDHSELAPASDELVRQINADIQARRTRNRAGRTLEEPIDGGLVRARGDFLYPITRGVPVLLRDEAIAIGP